MLILSYIVGFILGIFFFMIINESFDIFYFGFKGIFSTFCGCWFAGTLIALFLGWIAIIAIPIVFGIKFFSKGKFCTQDADNSDISSEEVSNDN